MIKHLCDRVMAVAGAFLGSQVPQFLQLYTQRLSGYVDALQTLIEQLKQIAATSHKSIEQYVLKFQESGDADFSGQASFMQHIFTRHSELKQTLTHLTEGPAWLKPYYFIKEFQPAIAKSTLESFEWGVNFTLEGLAYALAGMLLGWALTHWIGRLLSSLFKKKA